MAGRNRPKRVQSHAPNPDTLSSGSINPRLRILNTVQQIEEKRSLHIKARRHRHSPQFDRPNMSDLRIVLIGKNESENNRVGNILLGTEAFHREAASYSQQHSVRLSGEMEKRHVSVINTPHLLQLNLTQHQITQRVRECVSLSAPGPHVFVLVLLYNNFNENDRQRVKYVLNLFSEQAMKHTIVLTTDEETRGYIFTFKNNSIHGLIKECGGGHLQFDTVNPGWRSELFRRTEEILKKESEEFLICNKYEDEEEEDSGLNESTKTARYGGAPEGVKLSLVVCGSNRGLKSFISNLILKQSERRSELSSECVRRDVELDGRLISLLELPALFNTQLSEEEVMRQTHRCVSLCHPGVHVFIFIIPDAPLNNEDRAEIEEIQRIFSSRINKHIMILIKQDPEHQTAELNEETQSVIQSLGGRHQFIDLNTQVSVLMEKLEQMVEENSGDCFSTETLMEAQMEKLKEFEEMKMRIHSLETWFQSQELAQTSAVSSEGSSSHKIADRESDDTELEEFQSRRKDTVSSKRSGAAAPSKRESPQSFQQIKDVDEERKCAVSDLRIVLIGKNGSENRRVANTILGRAALDRDAPYYLQQSSDRISEEVEEKKITVFNPHLLQTHFPQGVIIEGVRECVSLSAPGPHVFVLVLQNKDFSENDRHRVKYVLNLFSKQAMKHTIVLTTDEETRRSILASRNNSIHGLIKECGGGHLKFNTVSTGWRSEMFRKTEEILKKECKECLICNMFEDEGEETSEDEDQSRSGASVRDDDEEEKDSDLKESTKTASYGGVSDLRIVLIGKNGSENRRVANTILGTEAFHREASSYSQQHSVRLSTEVEERHITVINTHLLQTNLTQQQITQTVRECVSLSAPGPHVFVLVLQSKDFNENDRHRVKYVLNLFSEQAIKHTIVLTTDEETRGFIFTSRNYSIHDLIKECGGGHLKFDTVNPGWRSELFRKTEEMLKKERKDFLICEMSTIDGDQSRSGASVRGDEKEKDSDLKESTETERDGGVSVRTTGKPKLNIVLCGNNSTLKNSVSRMFRGITSKPQKEGKEEVMRETLRCVSL
ncbi:hypothetical protein G5714_021132 [Onychostoma macrolepis]|uniref:AIG1-type G domain-containing protein n=1 Tax=Onychostoma macrolepis TaxID=369639 RepID=A0A7J6BQ87_9TELE|nr:hypothetical protein G5714_021132 [Onychostoma macrolepis]